MKIVNKNQIDEVVTALRNGEVVSFPTETVFGLAVIYDNFEAFNKLVKVKKRRPDKPFSMMLSDNHQIFEYAKINENGLKIINKFMPGEITILVDALELPPWVTLSTGVIGIRIPNDAFVRELIRKVGKPLLVTSANMSGQKPLTNAKDVGEVFKYDNVSYLVLGECVSETPSTVVDIRDKINVVRLGKITKEEIENSIK